MIRTADFDAPVNQLVKSLWYVKKDSLSASEQQDIIPPLGVIHIVYNFADPYYVIEHDQHVRVPDTALAGQFKKPIKVKYGSSLHQLGLAISPAALSIMFNQVGGLYSETMVNCAHFTSMQALHQTVKSAFADEDLDLDTRFERITAFFKNFYQQFMHSGETNTTFSELSAILEHIESSEDILEVGSLAESFSYSVSGLERLFKKHIGLTPKVYLDIVRFRKAMLLDDPTSLFYDQSHFIKQCRKYTLKIPRALSESEELTFMHVLGLDSDETR